MIYMIYILNCSNNSGIFQSLSILMDLDLKALISILLVFYFIFIYFEVEEKHIEMVKQFAVEIKNDLN